MLENNLLELFYDAFHKFKNCKCVTYVTDDSQSVTVSFSEMITQVEHFYNDLQRIVEVSQHEFIGITDYDLLPETIAMILGIWKSNNAFVFLDPTSSVGNLTAAIQKLNVRLIVGKQSACEQIRYSINLSPLSKTTFRISGNDFVIWKIHNRLNHCSSVYCNYAFAAFSSGSTGVAKIIKVPHDSLISNIQAIREIYKLQPTDTLFVSTPITFDPCITDILLAISSGSCVLLTKHILKFDPAYLSKFFSRNNYNATVWYTTPTLFLKWFPRRIENISMRILALGGEPFPNLDLETWPFLKNVQVYNLYGVTEVSCWASIYPVTNFNEPVLLGSALRDTILEVRTDTGVVIDEGIGEMYIGSKKRICVVDDENEFVPSPCFRATGDVVTIANKKYYYVGRKDRIIKLYGNRIDLFEIEKRILEHASVKFCRCFYVEEEQRIISLVELACRGIKVQDLEEFIKAQLPVFMLPFIYFVSQIPLNRHGKVSDIVCKSMYLNCKINEVIYSESFRNLWIKYTNQPIRTKEDELRGFIQSGGNSFSALLFSSSLADAGPIPDDLLAFLVSDKSYLDCLRLIERTRISGCEISHQVPPETSTGNADILEAPNDFEPRKGETQSNKLTRTVSKGRVINLEGKQNFYEQMLQKDNTHITIRWKHDLGKCVDASPTLLIFRDEALAVCGSHSGQLVAVNVETGNVLSRITLPDRIESSACASESGDSIFIGCYDKRMYCINIENFHIKWYFQTDDIVKSTAVCCDNRIYFGSYDHYFYCLSSIDGFLFWKLKIDEFPIYSAAVIIKNIVIVGTLGGNLAFIDRSNGIVKRTVVGKPFFSNPIEIPDQNLLIIIDVSGVLRLFDTKSFTQLCSHQVNGNVFSSVSISSLKTVKFIFGCHDNNVYCFQISGNTCSVLWKTEVDAPVYATPFVCENADVRVGNGVKHLVVAVSTSGNIYIIDTTGGHILTTFVVGHPVFSSPLVYNSNVLVGCRDNYLYCLSVFDGRQENR